jgi:phosphoribosyl-ATP pyrophosphohydrolase/phosphoribosyl-AMP cyclohydrolase
VNVKWDEQGLVPAIVVDAATGQVLTLAYMNAESLTRTESSGETWFWSRSRKELWHKGATSGNTQRVVSIAEDCDSDALVVRVIPSGPACHEGTPSCWTGPSGGALVLLDGVLPQRAKELPEASYTTRLLKDENLRIKKLGEECAELIRALLTGPDDRAAEEAADLLYHVAAALRARGISLSAVQSQLLLRMKGEEGARSPVKG